MEKLREDIMNDENDLTSVYIHGAFDESLMQRVVPKLDKALATLPKTKDAKIVIHISSPGGYVYVLDDILYRVEMLKAAGVIVETRVTSHAYSCGAMLAIAGSKGHRYMFSRAEQLLHFGSASTGRVYTPTELTRSTENIQRFFDGTIAHIKKHTKIPNIAKKIDQDNLFITAEQALEWGMVDEIV